MIVMLIKNNPIKNYIFFYYKGIHQYIMLSRF